MSSCGHYSWADTTKSNSGNKVIDYKMFSANCTLVQQGADIYCCSTSAHYSRSLPESSCYVVGNESVLACGQSVNSTKCSTDHWVLEQQDDQSSIAPSAAQKPERLSVMRQPEKVRDTNSHSIHGCKSELAIQERLQELTLLVQTLQATIYNGAFVWKILEVTRRRSEALSGKIISLYSAPFYTSRFGYKLCLQLYMDGDGSGKGTHLSFFLTIMKGEYDALLPWPFNQMVTLMLLDQSGNKKHIIQCFKPEPTSSSFWRPQSEMNVASGCPKFASLSVLHDSDHVKDDTMFFEANVDVPYLPQGNYLP